MTKLPWPSPSRSKQLFPTTSSALVRGDLKGSELDSVDDEVPFSVAVKVVLAPGLPQELGLSDKANPRLPRRVSWGSGISSLGRLSFSITVAIAAFSAAVADDDDDDDMIAGRSGKTFFPLEE